MLRNYLVMAIIGAVLAARAAGQPAPAAGQPAPAKVPVTADVGITSVVEKMRHSNGAGPATPIMQNQNWSGFENCDLLMAFDTKGIRGWTVSKAYMHVYLSKGDLYGIGLCTVLSPWAEGRALNGVEAEGAPCWMFRRTPANGAKPAAENWWSWPGSRFFSVSWSHPAARYSNAGPGEIEREKTADGRFLHLKFPVEPKVVEALAAGVAHGLVLTDDKGQVRESYSLLGPAYPYVYNASEDIWVFTKDIQDEGLRPWLEVTGAATDKSPPGAPGGLKVAEVSASEAAAVLTFTAPGDDGTSGDVLAYDAASSDAPITDENWSNATPLPRWSLPRPVTAGKVQRLPVFTLPAGKHHVAVRGVDEAGNRGPVASVAVDIPALADAALVEAAVERAPGMGLAPADEGPLTVSAVPDMVHVDPVGGGVARDGSYQADEAYLKENPVWLRPQINLQGAANEVVAFQVILGSKGDKLTNVRVAVADLVGQGERKIPGDKAVRTYRLWYVAGGGRRGAGGWHGEVCLPLAKPFEETFSIPAVDNKVPGQKYQSVWVDLHVPQGTPAGWYRGKITISADELKEPRAVTLDLKVLPLALPDENTFVMELNRYHGVLGFAGVPGGNTEQALKAMWDYYALGHQHRACLNVLPYSHSGAVDGDYIPKMAGKGTDAQIEDWTEWDRRFGPLLDGSAFSADKGYFGPGAGVPVHHMYTAFHEAWPIWLDATTYKDFKDVQDRLGFAEYAKQARRPQVAFTDAYKQAYVRVARQWFEHMKEKRYTRTSFHLFGNNKYYWKVAYFGGMGRGGVCFWLMDEPSDFDDYDANGFVMNLGLLGHKAANAPEVRADGRVDVSQPDMARGLWDDIATVWCVGGFRGFAETASVRMRWLPNEKHWSYGGGIGVGAPPVGMEQAALMRWSFGATGWMPWWDTFRGTGPAWTTGDSLAIYYSGKNYAGSGKDYPGAIASVRLKSLRRAQQDIEYLNLLAGKTGWDRGRVRLVLAKYCDDPGEPLWSFGKLTLDRVEELRRRVAATVAAK